MLPINPFIILTLGLLLIAGQERLQSQTSITDLLGNQVSVNVSGSSSFDASNGLYTYTYTIRNAINSAEEVRYFALRLGGTVMPDVLNPVSPPGWRYHAVDGRPIIRWGANSTSRIKPGQQLGGFSFQSHAAPGNVTYYAKGYVQGPQAALADLDDEHAQDIPDFTQIGVNGTTIGPISSLTTGPLSVRGFVVILAPMDSSISSAPIQVHLKFAVDGESIDRTTFNAVLNGLDVTKSFATGTNGGDLQATFNLGTSPLQSGNNNFIASVAGTDPQNGGSTTGTSRITFTVAKTIPGDVDGDGIVDCSDIKIVLSAFGKKTGEAGYDLRADVNLDGVVDIHDFAFVTQSLPAATTCSIGKTPPVISGMPAKDCTLWPPNHKFVHVADVKVSAPLPILGPGALNVFGTSNEPSNPNDPDIVITADGSGGFVVQLRADRLGTGRGRIYTLTATATDLLGNIATSTATCTVPHDQGH